MIIRYHTWYNWVVMVVTSWALYIIFVVIVNNGRSYNSFATMDVAFQGGKFYLNFMLIVGACFIIDVLTSSLDIIFSDKITNKLMIFRSERKTSLNTRLDLPVNICRLLDFVDAQKQIEGTPGEVVSNNNVNRINVDTKKLANEEDLEQIDRVPINQPGHENKKKMNLGTDPTYKA